MIGVCSYSRIQGHLGRNFALVLLALTTLIPLAYAGGRPLRVIVPQSAGSGIDLQMRAIAPSLSKALGGRALVIENLAGAGGVTGTNALVQAKGDGNTIAMVSSNHAVNPSVYKEMPYDSLVDIKPIAVIGETPFVLVVNSSKISADSVNELRAILKANPGKFNYASSGNGTATHLAAAMVIDALAVDVRHIPYKGLGPMMVDLIGGRTEMGVVPVNVALTHLKSGAVRAIATTGRRMVPALAGLPTMAEQGYPEIDFTGWFAIIGPGKLSASAAARLHAAVIEAFNYPEARSAMSEQQVMVRPMSLAESIEFFRTELNRYANLAKKANIKID